MQEWLDYKRAKGEGYKKASFVQRLLDRFATVGAASFVAAVNYSIGNNYMGLFADKEKHGGSSGKPSSGKWYDEHATGVGDI